MRRGDSRARTFLLVSGGGLLFAFIALFLFLQRQSSRFSDPQETERLMGELEAEAQASEDPGSSGPELQEPQRVAEPYVFPEQAPAWLVVSASETGEALADAVVRARSPLHEYESFECDEAGRADLPSVGAWALEVRAPGFVARRLQGRVGPGELDVRLERAGSIEVRVRRTTGEPVPAAKVVLVPAGGTGEVLESRWSATRLATLADHELDRMHRQDLAELPLLDPREPGPIFEVGQGEWVDARVAWSMAAPEWRRESDSEGRIRWDGLAPSSGYRVEWVGPGFAELDPRDPSSRFEEVEGRVLVKGGPDRTVTAGLTVVAGETTLVTATRPLPSRVHGRLDSEGGRLISPSRVRLSDWEDIGVGSIRGGWNLEGGVVPSHEGFFEFDDVSPGRKRLDAQWSINEGVVLLASREFDVGHGEVRDLGSLKPMGGPDLVLEFPLIDQRGARLRADEVFEPEAAAVLQVSLSLLPSAMEPGLRVRCGLTAEVGSSVVLRGLTEGTVHTSARLLNEDDLRLRPGFGITPPGYAELHVPSDRIEALPTYALRKVRTRLRVSLPGPGPFPRIEGTWMLAGYPEVMQFDLRTPEREQDTNVREFEWMQPAGDYRVLLTDHSLGQPAEGSGLVWVGELSLAEGDGVHEVVMQQGTSLSGTVLDAAGLPAKNVPSVAVGWLGWERAGRLHPLYHAPVDGDGRYRMRGLPPDTTLRTFEVFGGGTPAQDFETGAPGSHLTLDLRAGAR